MPKRPCLQFSLRTLLLITAASAVLLWLWTLYVAPYRAEEAVKSFAVGKRRTKILLDGDGRIRSLYVGRTDYSLELLKHLRGLTKLEYLSLNGPQITDEVLAHLSGLKRLNRLNLGIARVSDAGFSSTNITGAGLVHLRHLTQLRDLRISTRKRIDGKGLSYLAGLTNLELLYIENDTDWWEREHLFDGETRSPPPACANITGAGLVHLKALTKLEYLLLGATEVHGPGLAHLEAMQNLRQLYLHGSPVNDSGLPHLAALKRLEWVDLGSGTVTDEAVKKLQLVLPGCKIHR